MAVIFMFSGQGSQYFQMGQEFFETQPVFRQALEQLDEIAQDLLGRSIIDSIFAPTGNVNDPFDQTLLTHPAIFMVEIALTRLLNHWGLEADYLLGTSLGEFAAAAVSGAVSCEEGLELVIRQAEILEDCCEQGGMIAVLDSPTLWQALPSSLRKGEFAAQNFDRHFTLSGSRQAIIGLDTYLRSKNIPCQILPVTMGFHSSSLTPAAIPFLSLLGQKVFNRPLLPMISCLQGDFVSDLEGSYFWDVIREPILFPEAIQKLEVLGEHNYIDVGPSGTLATFVKYNLRDNSESTFHSVLTPFRQDQKNLDRLLAQHQAKLLLSPDKPF